MLPFEPEPIDKLKERFPAALTPVYTLADVINRKIERPGLQRKHVFDFEHGVRMIVSVEYQTGLNPLLHLSFSGKFPLELHDQSGFILFCHQLAKDFTGGKFGVGHVSLTDKAIHIFYKIAELFS